MLFTIIKNKKRNLHLCAYEQNCARAIMLCCISLKALVVFMLIFFPFDDICLILILSIVIIEHLCMYNGWDYDLLLRCMLIMLFIDDNMLILSHLTRLKWHYFKNRLKSVPLVLCVCVVSLIIDVTD